MKSTYFWYPVALFGFLIGLYPLIYLLVDMTSNGLLAGKGHLKDQLSYVTIFYVHIYGGGIALLVGWTQFKGSWRRKYLSTHRMFGKIYLISVLFFSAPAGLIIAYFADGSIPSQFGFSFMAILWWFTSYKAYQQIRAGNIENHKDWMTRSYALCFAAVTLRIYLPLFLGGFGWEYIPAYQAIAWLCWVPNLIFAEWLIDRRVVLV